MSESKKLDNFCCAPWNATYYKESLQKYKMCCAFTTWTSAKSPEDYFNSNLVKDVRETILRGEWHPGCKVCKEQAEAGLSSDRLMFNSHMDIKNNPVDTNKFKLKWLDFRPGNLCNLKCRMCSGSNSSMIQQEVEKNPELKEFENDKPINNTDLLPSICNHETFSELEVLKLLGGEPTIDPQIQKLLDWTIENGYAKNINLRYTTNATNVNAKWVKAVNQFKTSKAQISLDGAGETYDYIRTNANWEAVRKNVLKIPELMPNVTSLGTNVVFSTYNCFTIDTWLPQLFNLTEEVQSTFNLQYNLHIINCTGPTHMVVRNLPDEFKQIVMDKLDILENDNAKYHKMIGAFKYFVQQEPNRDIVETQTKFFKHNDMLDRIRKTNINDLSPVYEKLRQITI